MLQQTIIDTTQHTTNCNIYHEQLKIKLRELLETKIIICNDIKADNKVEIFISNNFAELEERITQSHVVKYYEGSKNTLLHIYAYDNDTKAKNFNMVFEMSIQAYEMINNITKKNKSSWYRLLLSVSKNEIIEYVEYIEKYEAIRTYWNNKAYEEYGQANEDIISTHHPTIGFYRNENFFLEKEQDNRLMYVWARLLRISYTSNGIKLTNGEVAMLVASGIVMGRSTTLENVMEQKSRINNNQFERECAYITLVNILSHELYLGNFKQVRKIDINLEYPWLTIMLVNAGKARKD